MKICMHAGCQMLDGHLGWHGRWDSELMQYVPLKVLR